MRNTSLAIQYSAPKNIHEPNFSVELFPTRRQLSIHYNARAKFFIRIGFQLFSKYKQDIQESGLPRKIHRSPANVYVSISGLKEQFYTHFVLRGTYLFIK